MVKTFAELRSQVNVCLMFSGAVHSAIFIGSFHDYRKRMRKRNERVGAQKLSIFDEFNGRNLVDEFVCVYGGKIERERKRENVETVKSQLFMRVRELNLN